MNETPDDPLDRELSSPACLMSEASDVYMGYAGPTELIALLRQVLESQAAGSSASSPRTDGRGERIRALKSYLRLLGVEEPACEGWLRSRAEAIEGHAEPGRLADQLRQAAAEAIAAALPRVRNQRLHDDLAAILRAESEREGPA